MTIVEHIEAAGAKTDDPWKRLQAMCSAYLDACHDPHLPRILVLEAPVVLGWKTWCNLEQNYEVAAFTRCLEILPLSMKFFELFIGPGQRTSTLFDRWVELRSSRSLAIAGRVM